ncbi:MAG TPA: alpha/beta fold hydrolase [Blastocatellia bacterium]|nr:alpha/beta fold hydrolase [Blastocatellia bacterium]
MNRNRLLTFALVSVSFVLLATRFALGNGFTLEQVTSSPFPSDLIASQKGDRVAWVFDAEGKRNIWVAEAPAFKGRQLTRYDKDDGQEITEPEFSPDGNWIAFVFGGPPNSEKDIPNPTSDPAGAKQEVRVANVRTGVVMKTGEGTRPFFSPRSDRVIFSHEDHLWWAPVPAAKGPATRPNGAAKKMFEIRGSVASPAWSPDGSQLAFVSARGDHSFIAIYEPKASSIRFLGPSVDRDIEPRWSPDGKRIAYIRLFNITDVPSLDRERIVPWAIRVVDVNTGQGKEIWKSGNAWMDSFSRLPLGDSILQWAAGDRLVFASEKDGWAHLYSVPATGGPETALTPGNYEVENVAWSPDRSHVVVASNDGDIDHRHLWKVNLAGGRPEQLTSGGSIEMYPVMVNGGKQIAFMHSTANHPLLPYIASSEVKGKRPLAPQALPGEFPAGQLTEPEQVLFKAADGLEIHGQYFKPKGVMGKAPAVVFMHGGPMRQMLLGWHYNYYYHNAYAMNQYLASRGYAVLSVNYRAGIGYGRAFREARHRGARGASEYQDIVAAGKYLKSRSDIDAKRIGLWGGSYGGFLTAMGLARDSDLFAAGVDVHGVHDWSARVGRGPGASPDLIRLARESSPISSVDKWKSPVLLIHGDDDRNVAFSQTVDLVRKLREHGVQFEELVFPDEVHDFLRHQDWLRAYHAALDFFDKRMK